MTASLDERRSDELMAALVRVDVARLALVQTIALGDPDEIDRDADELAQRAYELRDWAVQLARDWRAQRTETS